MQKWLDEESYKYLVQTSEIHYLLEWVPKTILEAEGITFQNPYDIRSYVALTLFEKIMATPEYIDMLPEGMVYSLGKLLQEVNKNGFRTADDYHTGEIQ